MKKNGFTLIELILYVAIIGIVMMALIPFAINTGQVGAKSSTQQEVYSQARYISERLKMEIRNSNGINTASSTFGTNLVTSGQISLVTDGTTNPTLIDVSSGKVRIKQGSLAATNIQSNNTTVTSLVFTNYSSVDNKSKNIGFVLNVANSSGSTSASYQESVTIRSSAEVRSN